MVTALGHISGGHFNPAVTLGFLVTRRIKPCSAPATGPRSSAERRRGASPQVDLSRQRERRGELGAPTLNTRSPSAGFILEAVLTFFLVWVVFATAADPRGAFTVIAGFAIGLTIAADILIGGPLTGAAMNPGRALGPMLVQNQWANGGSGSSAPSWAARSRRSPTRCSTSAQFCGRGRPERRTPA